MSELYVLLVREKAAGAEWVYEGTMPFMDQIQANEFAAEIEMTTGKETWIGEIDPPL